MALAFTDAAALPACEQEALAGLFGGDANLFLGFRNACMHQFPLDWEQARQLLAQRQDWSALARLAHSLKGVLHTLGYAELGLQAQGLQERAQAAQEYAPADAEALAACAWTQAATQWLGLQRRMAQAFALDLGPDVARPSPGL